MIRKLVVVLLTGVICLVGVTSALAVTYNEAPMLRTMVAAGELPPVEERLPSEPLVIQPKDEIGKYGGTLVGIKHSPGNWYMIAHLNVEPLMELDPENALKIVPNIARDWEWNEDKSELTIYLRRGIRWSDGEPFTADDIAFQFEDVIFNEELNPVVPGTWIANGEPVKFTKVDDYTVSFNYNGPNNPSEIYKFTPTLGYDTLYLPAHYFKQFHIKYNPDADALAKEEDYDSWWQLFQEIYWKSLPYIHYPGPPYIYAWVPKTVTVERTVWERNPYYWKVDTAGNQLPYLDGMVGVLVVESELVKAKGIAGEFDFLVEGLTMDEVFLLNQNAEKNNYKVIIGPNTWAGAATYYVNQNHKDPVKRELFRNVDFRRALSLAINRDEINEMVFFGMGTPLLGIALGDEPFYDAEVRQAEKEAIRYDVDAANRLLDEIGLTERDKDGYRVTSDGEPLVLEIITSTGLPDLVKVPELVSAYWLDIGIKTTFKVMERTLRYLKRDSGELDVTVYIAEPSALRYRTNPGRWSVQALEWAPFWNTWYDSKGTLGEEPTGEAKRLFELGEMMPNADDDEWVSMGKEFLMNCIRNMWLIGTVGLPPRPMIFRKTLANLYEDLAWTNATAGNFRNRAYQWWFK